MRVTACRALLFCLCAAATGQAQSEFNIPLRINMGAPETVDSYGRTWLGDGPGNGDPLNIRPDDAGGQNFIVDWPAAGGQFQPDSLDLLGFDSTNPGDVLIFNSIRWDDAATPPNFLMEIPIPAGDYTVNLYFNEGCCTGRHFQISLQDEIVDNDVSYEDYDPANPAIGRVGRLSFPGQVVGDDHRLKIGLLPCNLVDCPTGTDNNAIVNAIEVISAPECDHLGLDFNCLFRPGTNDVVGTWTPLPGADGFRITKNGAQFGADLPGSASSFTDPNPQSGGLSPTYVLQALDGGIAFRECRCSVTAATCPTNLLCTPDPSGKSVLTWTAGTGYNFTGFEVRRDGVLLTTLPANAISYEDTPDAGRLFTYTVTPISNPPSGCAPLTCLVLNESRLFDIPLRINMGGAEVVDSKGRTWLGDGPGPGDRLGIRPEDLSGANWIENWCAVDSASLRNLGFDAQNAADRYIMSTIRWDLGAIAQDFFDFYIELPIPNANDYLLNLYFNECCCPTRHFKLEINGELVNEDVSIEDYASPPGVGKVGRLSFTDVVVDSEVLRIGLLPCDPADCPGATDDNAIINAIEVIQNPCLEEGFRQCPSGLSCSILLLNQVVTGAWEGPLCFTPTGYEVYRDGEKILDLPGTALSFQNKLESRVGNYEVRTLVPAGQDPCPPMTCVAVNPQADFEVPLRLNMGGRSLVDSRGNLWIGDQPGPGDALDIRPDDTGGANWIENWCGAASITQADSMQSLGLDPLNPNNQAIFNTIRWDDGATLEDFRISLPIANGTYLLNFYFTECCCFNRHFMLEVEGEIIEDDVHAGDYSAVDRVGRTGRLTFDSITVSDGLLDIGFLPCLDCDPTPFPAVDINAIIDAIEVLPAGTIIKTCPRDLICTLDGGSVDASWTPAVNMNVGGYDVYRNGTKISTLPANATSFADDAPPCDRVLIYEVAVLTDGSPDFLCPTERMRCVLIQPECPFVAPVRINMGGSETEDSKGNLWLGDGPGAGDPLEIRPDDLGGDQWIESWSTGVMNADSFIALGLDPTHPGDQYIFNTIRWDVGGNPPDFNIEIPIENGTYTVNMYFNEQCCPGRHFKIELEGEIVDDDVSFLDYDPAEPALGKLGRLSFQVTVEDDILNVNLLPCPECPGAIDNNAILDALEVLSSSGVENCSNGTDDDGDQQIDCADADCAGNPICQGVRFHRGDADSNGSLQLTDAIRILGVLFLGQGSIDCNDAADADDNGQLQLTDAIRILGVLFLGLGQIPPPGPTDQPCGLDTTNDALNCASYAAANCQ
jgi:hypothetical protein